MSESPFSRSKLLPKEGILWMNPSEKRQKVSFAETSSLQEERVAILSEGLEYLYKLECESITQKNGLHTTTKKI